MFPDQVLALWTLVTSGTQLRVTAQGGEDLDAVTEGAQDVAGRADSQPDRARIAGVDPVELRHRFIEVFVGGPRKSGSPAGLAPASPNPQPSTEPAVTSR